MSKFKDYIIIILLVICICCSVAAATKTGVIQGEQGEQGIQGIQGEVGPQGLQGPQGEQGLQGIQGETGLTGAKGDKGDKGDTGIQGPQGIPGKDGKDGRDGQDGLTPYIGADGNWYIGTNNTGVAATELIVQEKMMLPLEVVDLTGVPGNLPQIDSYLEYTGQTAYIDITNVRCIQRSDYLNEYAYIGDVTIGTLSCTVYFPLNNSRLDAWRGSSVRIIGTVGNVYINYTVPGTGGLPMNRVCFESVEGIYLTSN